MKKISETEANKLVELGYGIGFFMGGFGGDETKPFIEVIEDEFWLIERNEKDTDEYKQLMIRQNQEAEEYCKSIQTKYNYE